MSTGSALEQATGSGDKSVPRRRARWVIASVVAVVAVAGGVAGLWVANAPGGTDSGGAGSSRSQDSHAATATVERRTLAAQTEVDATLDYAGDYNVINRSQGTITALPDLGDVVRQGSPLYWVNGTAVPLFYGAVPAYRPLSVGDTGRDVRQLNADLVALGYDDTGELDPASDEYTWATRAAVENLQDHLGIDATGALALGTIAFLPTAARITSLAASVGSPVGPAQPVLTATSTAHQVSVALDVALQSAVKVGDAVTITLPDDQTTRGVVTSVGTVASNSSGDSSGSGTSSDSNPTIEVLITPKQPQKLGSLDKAPVQVSITTDRAPNALVVPLGALLAQAGGSYAVEVVRPDGTRRLVKVTLGLVDDADGLVAVTGDGLAAGQTIVVPES